MEKPEVIHVPEFDRDMNKLRRFRSIEDDLEVFEKALIGEFPKLLPQTVIISNVGQEFHPMWHVAKFHCEYLRHNFKIRVIYTYNPYTHKIILIEIYFKGDKDNHDQTRLKKYAIKKIQQPSNQSVGTSSDTEKAGLR